MHTNCRFFASCPRGTEDLLSEEIRQIGVEIDRNAANGAYFSGDISSAYKLCLWSRIANRVLLILTPDSSQPFIDSADQLYQAASNIPWEAHLDVSRTFAVQFTGTNKVINNELFGAAKVKDAIVDRMRAHYGERPSVAKVRPDVQIQVRLHRDKVSIAIDLSGDSLHKRGYRLDQGVAPLKENLAAAMLIRSGWPDIMRKGGVLVDPMCGSGTFLIEGAMMVLGLAPGLLRERWGFVGWRGHDDALWQTLLEAAKDGMKGADSQLPLVCYGYDHDDKMIRVAGANVERASLQDHIQLSVRSLAAFERPADCEAPGLIITNPPYGERLGEMEALKETYLTLSRVVKDKCAGWHLAVLSGNTELAKEMRLRAKKRNRFMNGPIASELWIADVLSAEKAILREDARVADMPLSDGATMVLNRLEKNDRKLRAWRDKNQISCYRLYDADIPEYAAAVDVYDGKVHVQEYAAPKSVDEQSAKKRLRELMLAVARKFNTLPADIPLKTRERNKGRKQYDKVAETDRYAVVQEGRASLRINLHDYLDTGLFLDHRPLRERIAQEAIGKSFLNLFCYTATATVHAALGGAKQSVSVDMSKTYLDWASQNFNLNRIKLSRHELVQSDCLKWLQNCRQGFDLIMLDPPSFSNSKRMQGVLDVQRDHASLIQRCMDILNPGGVLYFSTNLRKFKLNNDALIKWQVEDISLQTIDKDFERNSKIHRCFRITHA